MSYTNSPLDWRELHQRKLAIGRAVSTHPSFAVAVSVLMTILPEAFDHYAAGDQVDELDSGFNLNVEKIKAALNTTQSPLPDEWISGLAEISMHGVDDPPIE